MYCCLVRDMPAPVFISVKEGQVQELLVGRSLGALARLQAG
jgi:hypothetical protein